MIGTDPTSVVLDRLDGVRGGANSQWEACCPSHDDNTASLSIKRGDDGRAVLHCHAGCPTQAVVEAVGLTMADLFPEDPLASPVYTNGATSSRTNGRTSSKLGRIVAEYDYLDERGELVFQAVRYDPKGFRQRKPDGKGGWIPSVKDCRHVPYRLPELLANRNAAVYVAEGEKDVHALEAVGLLATCNAGGAGKWKADHAKHLEGRQVVVLPDHDQPGRDHARKVAQSLQGIAASVKVVELPGLPEKGDVTDWINSHGDAATPKTIAANLAALVVDAPEWAAPNSSPQDELQEIGEAEQETEPVSYRRITCKELASGDYALDYLIDGTMAKAQPLIIAGPQKTLKTSIIIDAAISLAVGGCFLGRLNVPSPSRVAVMSGESGLATIQETAFRVSAAAGKHLADIDNLFWSPDIPKFGDAHHLIALDEFLASNEIAVLFIDPAYLAIPSQDSGNLMAQGELLRGMSAMCERMGVTMVLAHHTKKNTLTAKDEPPELADIAWAGFAEFARQWWLLGRREKYEPGTGEHKLWLSVGGSAGHSALWGVDVSEGVYSEHSQRSWDVVVRHGHECLEKRFDDREERKRRQAEEKAAEQAKADLAKVVATMTKLKQPETKSNIKDASRLSASRANAALLQLEGDNVVRKVTVERTNGQKYEGYELCSE